MVKENISFFLFKISVQYMGAGILPTAIHNGKLFFLFGKENKYETSAPGFSDFGGGTDHQESFLETAVREAGEELTGFLGTPIEIRKMLKKGTFIIDNMSEGHNTYRMYIFFYPFNPWLPHFYNNNQLFLQKHLPAQIIKTTKIFEKERIEWICIDELHKRRPQFRHYFRSIVDQIIEKKQEIYAFIERRNRSSQKNTRKRILF